MHVSKTTQKAQISWQYLLWKIQSIWMGLSILNTPTGMKEDSADSRRHSTCMVYVPVHVILRFRSWWPWLVSVYMYDTPEGQFFFSGKEREFFVTLYNLSATEALYGSVSEQCCLQRNSIVAEKHNWQQITSVLSLLKKKNAKEGSTFLMLAELQRASSLDIFIVLSLSIMPYNSTPKNSLEVAHEKIKCSLPVFSLIFENSSLKPKGAAFWSLDYESPIKYRAKYLFLVLSSKLYPHHGDTPSFTTSFFSIPKLFIYSHTFLKLAGIWPSVIHLGLWGG